MPHVDDGTLHALLDGALRAEEPGRADRVAAHLETCADCRARLEQAATLKDQAAGILDTLEAGRRAESPGPDFQEVLARARARAGDADPDTATGAGARPAASPRGGHRAAVVRRYRWTRGLAWAATIVIALGTGYLVRDLAGPGPVSPAAPERPTPAAERGSEGEAPARRQRAEAEEPAPRVQDATPGAEGVAPAGGTGAPSSRADVRELEAAAAPQRPGGVEPGTMALEQIVVTGVAGATEERWLATSREEAEARVGPILMLPGARIAGTELSADGETVRTLQLLSGDVEVRVIQGAADSALADSGAAVLAGGDELEVGEEAEAAPSARARAVAEEADRGRVPEQPRAALVSRPADAPALVQLGLDSVAATVSEPSTVTVTRDGITLTLTGRLTRDILRALAALAAPAPD